MPVAVSNPTAQSSPAAGANSNGAGGASLLPIATGAAPAAGANGSPANFLLVLAQQLSAEPTTVQNVTTAAIAVPFTTAAPPTALTELFALDVPQGAGEDTDSDTDETGDEDGALAMATFLPGLCSLATPAHGSAWNAPLDSTAAVLGGTQDSSSDAAILAAADAFLAATSDQSTADADAATTPTNPSAQAAHAAQAHSGLTNHVAASSDAAQMARDLRAPVGTPAWSDELGGQLTWMAANGRESASLRLSPENMGPLEIRISVQDGEATVWFGATNADTRSALEQSLPRLRELFASQGLVLADAGVYRDAPRDRPGANSFSGATPPAETDAAAGVNSVTIAHAGLIDTYV